jgi:histidine triad (HIT) family protein
MAECIFCEIIDGIKPSTKIFEDRKTLAFLDIYPVARGHTLVIPKVHSDNLYDIQAEDIAAVGLTVARIAKTLKKILKCDGINVYQGNEPAAMQEVMHTHFHVIPRYFNDEIIFGASRNPLKRDDLLFSKLQQEAKDL